MFENIYAVLAKLGNTFLEWILDTFPAMMLAAFGATIRSVSEDTRNWLWQDYFAGVVLAMFVGYVVDSMLSSLPMTAKSRSITIAVSGYFAGEIVRAWKNTYKNRLIIFLGGEVREKSDKKKTD